MPILNLPKLNIKNLLLLAILLIISTFLGLISKIAFNKSQAPTAQAQGCWTASGGGGSAGSEGSEGGAGSAGSGGGGSCGCESSAGEGCESGGGTSA